VTVSPDLTHNGDRDAFVAKVNPAGTVLVYAGYIGGTGGDEGDGIAVDRTGAAYHRGHRVRGDLPGGGGPGPHLQHPRRIRFGFCRGWRLSALRSLSLALAPSCA